MLNTIADVLQSLTSFGIIDTNYIEIILHTCNHYYRPVVENESKKPRMNHHGYQRIDFAAKTVKNSGRKSEIVDLQHMKFAVH